MIYINNLCIFDETGLTMRILLLLFLIISFNSFSQDLSVINCLSGSKDDYIVQNVPFDKDKQLMVIETYSKDGFYIDGSSDTLHPDTYLICMDNSGLVIWKNRLDSFNRARFTVIDDSIILIAAIDYKYSRDVVTQYYNKDGIATSPIYHIKNITTFINSGYVGSIVANIIQKGNSYILECQHLSFYTYYGMFIPNTVYDIIYCKNDTLVKSIPDTTQMPLSITYSPLVYDTIKKFVLVNNFNNLIAFNFDLSNPIDYSSQNLWFVKNVFFSNNIIWKDEGNDTNSITTRYKINLINNQIDTLILEDKLFYLNSNYYISKVDSIYYLHDINNDYTNQLLHFSLSDSVLDMRLISYSDTLSIFLVKFWINNQYNYKLLFIKDNIVQWYKTLNDFGLRATNMDNILYSPIYYLPEKNKLFININEIDSFYSYGVGDYFYQIDLITHDTKFILSTNGSNKFIYTYQNNIYAIINGIYENACHYTNNDIVLLQIEKDVANYISEKSNIDFRLFPNPTNNTINISFSSLNNIKNPTLNVIDITGKIISQTVLPNNTLQHIIDVSKFPIGMYFIQIDVEDLQLTKKFQVIH